MSFYLILGLRREMIGSTVAKLSTAEAVILVVCDPSMNEV